MVQSSSFRSRFKDRKRSFSCACLLPTVWFWLILGVSLQHSSAGSAAGMAGHAWTSSASARRASLGPTVSSVSHCSVPFQSKAMGVVPAGPLPLVRGGRWNNHFSEMEWNTWKKCWVWRMGFSWQSVHEVHLYSLKFKLQVGFTKQFWKNLGEQHHYASHSSYQMFTNFHSL